MRSEVQDAMKIVLASRNANKIREVKRLLSEVDARLAEMEIVSLDDMGILGEIEENGSTFEENALIKARVGAEKGFICLADDSGLEVDALDGAPGVYSARYAGENPTDDERNNQLLLKKLDSVPEEKRTARYTCCIACVFPDGREYVTKGSCEGVMLREYCGTGGFGYDPLFYVPALKKTFAQVTMEEKNTISHRGIAVRKMAEILKEVLF